MDYPTSNKQQDIELNVIQFNNSDKHPLFFSPHQPIEGLVYINGKKHPHGHIQFPGNTTAFCTRCLNILSILDTCHVCLFRPQVYTREYCLTCDVSIKGGYWNILEHYLSREHYKYYNYNHVTAFNTGGVYYLTKRQLSSIPSESAVEIRLPSLYSEAKFVRELNRRFRDEFVDNMASVIVFDFSVDILKPHHYINLYYAIFNYYRVLQYTQNDPTRLKVECNGFFNTTSYMHLIITPNVTMCSYIHALVGKLSQYVHDPCPDLVLTSQSQHGLLCEHRDIQSAGYYINHRQLKEYIRVMLRKITQLCLKALTDEEYEGFRRFLEDQEN